MQNAKIQRESPKSGERISIRGYERSLCLIVDPENDLDRLEVQLPPRPTPGQQVMIFTKKAIGTLAIFGGTVNDYPREMSVWGSVTLAYFMEGDIWVMGTSWSMHAIPATYVDGIRKENAFTHIVSGTFREGKCEIEISGPNFREIMAAIPIGRHSYVPQFSRHLDRVSIVGTRKSFSRISIVGSPPVLLDETEEPVPDGDTVKLLIIGK